MNLQQQETKELNCDDNPSEKPMEYQQFLEILDKSANNITPRNELLDLSTPFSQRGEGYQAVTTKNTNSKEIFEVKSRSSNMPSTIKGDQSIQLPQLQPDLSVNVSKLPEDLPDFENDKDTRKNYESANTQDFFTLGSPNNIREKESKILSTNVNTQSV